VEYKIRCGDLVATVKKFGWKTFQPPCTSVQVRLEVEGIAHASSFVTAEKVTEEEAGYWTARAVQSESVPASVGIEWAMVHLALAEVLESAGFIGIRSTSFVP
jgi:hypothetical protein